MQKGSVNKVVLVGHLGGDPETRFTHQGCVANFNLATNESWRCQRGYSRQNRVASLCNAW